MSLRMCAILLTRAPATARANGLQDSESQGAFKVESIDASSVRKSCGVTRGRGAFHDEYAGTSCDSVSVIPALNDGLSTLVSLRTYRGRL